jgi:hypothetical protein
MRVERLVVLALSLLALAPQASLSTEGRSSRVGNDVFAAGDHAAIRAEVNGDALLAGGEVTLEGRVGGDAALAGGRIALRGDVGEDVYAAGGELTIAGRIGGSARLAGGEITVTEDASVADGLSLAGGRIELLGHVGQYAQIAGGEVRINGRVDGDVNVSSGSLVVGPDTVIEGRLTYRGREEARVSENARVRDGVVHVPARRHGRAFERMFTTFTVIWLAGWTIVGILLLALLPHASRTVTDTLRARPGTALLVGLALLCVIPIVIVLGAITVVGLPLALLLVCLYLVLLPIGYLISVAALGDWLLPKLRRGKPVTTAMRIGTFILAIIIVYLLTRVPMLGGLVALLVVLAGIGALGLSIGRRRTAATAAP